MTHILYQLQLSVYNTSGKFILTADSNWQIFVTKAINMIKFDPNIKIDVLVPTLTNCIESCWNILEELGLEKNVTPIEIEIAPNALKTRFDFPYDDIEFKIGKKNLESYTHVYINDPMLVRHYRAMFFLKKLHPKFITQIHFLDSPEGRIVDEKVSYWLGICEAAQKVDHVLMHSQSQLKLFTKALKNTFKSEVVEAILEKTSVWKDGYSIDEIRKPINEANIRFDTKELDGKTIIWLPNRVGGLGKSFDYTRNGEVLFDLIPQLWKQRQDFVVMAGNGNQKISNEEIRDRCPAYHYLPFGAVNRDEYRWISQRADIVGAFYDAKKDQNGGLAALESIEFKAIPLFTNDIEYKVYFDAVNWQNKLRIDPDLSNFVEVTSRLLDKYKSLKIQNKMFDLRDFIRQYAAYEYTTNEIMLKLFQ